MYKKILFIIMVAFGMFTMVGCHDDSDDEIEVRNDKDGQYLTFNWGLDETYVGVINEVKDGKVYFKIPDYDKYEASSRWSLFMTASEKWFNVGEWSGQVDIGTEIKFKVKKVEYFEPNRIHIPEPSNVHFFIVPAAK